MTAKGRDAFKLARTQDDSFALDVDNESIPMLLSYRAVRDAAKDWNTYSSNAPFRVPIPAEHANVIIDQTMLISITLRRGR